MEATQTTNTACGQIFSFNGKEVYRYAPKGSRAVTHGLGVCYVQGGPTITAIGYKGKAGNASFNYSFRTIEKRDEYVANFFRSLEAHEQIKAERKAADSKPHTVKVGDIFSSSWGYDQTNVDFYEVTATTAHGATIREIAQERTETGHMSGTCTGKKGAFCGKEIRVRVDAHNSAKVGRQHASIWNGAPKYWSSYA